MTEIEQKNILDKIVATKQKEIEALPDFEFFTQEFRNLNDTKGFFGKLQRAKGPALIAEVKKASPSKGVLREDFDPLTISQAYEEGGAHCLSVLTDKDYFQGNLKDLQKISSKSSLPCLRKDFIIDKRQIAESRLAGADAILLIAAILDQQQLQRLYDIAISLGLDVLMEIHNEEDMDKALNTPARLIGINNRDLKSFETDINTSIRLVEKYKTALENKTVVSESGISTRDDVARLYDAGIKAFLVGESLIKQDDLAQAVSNLLD